MLIQLRQLRQLRQHALQVALKTLTERLIFIEKVDGPTLRRDGLFQVVARRQQAGVHVEHEWIDGAAGDRTRTNGEGAWHFAKRCVEVSHE